MKRSYLLLLLIMPAQSFGMLANRFFRLQSKFSGRAFSSHWEKEHRKFRERQFRQMDERAQFLLAQLEHSKKLGQENSYQDFIKQFFETENNRNYLLGSKGQDTIIKRQTGEE